MVGFKKSEPIPETKVQEAIRNSAPYNGVPGEKTLKLLTNVCLWPKADVETEFNSLSFAAAFREYAAVCSWAE